MKTEKELWKLIEDAKWISDHDYNRISKEFQLLPKKIRKQLFEFIEKKHNELQTRFHNDWLASPGIRVSDDGWADLTAEVVGRGKSFYENISVKKLKEMAKNFDYHENFVYSTQTN